MGVLRFAFRALAALVCRCFVAPRSLSTLRREYGDGARTFQDFPGCGITRAQHAFGKWSWAMIQTSPDGFPMLLAALMVRKSLLD
jgi:hypothetical protein